MKEHRFDQVDVFTQTPYRGNPVAVVHDAASVSTADMAAFARWTNLSETTFLLPPTVPEADYQLRIFTPGGELPFAGHPTLGSCHAWLGAGGTPRQAGMVGQECGAGLVQIRRNQGRLSFMAPPLLRTGPIDDVDLQVISAALKLTTADIVAHQWVDNGPGWCALLLSSAERVLAAQPDFAALHGYNVGLVGPLDDASEADFEVRAFVPDLGVPEDPVTGSLNAGIAQWLMAEGIAPAEYIAHQGTRLDRDGKLFLSREQGVVWVAGATVTRITGQVLMP